MKKKGMAKGGKMKKMANGGKVPMKKKGMAFLLRKVARMSLYISVLLTVQAVAHFMKGSRFLLR